MLDGCRLLVTGHKDSVVNVAFNAKGDFLATGAMDGSIKSVFSSSLASLFVFWGSCCLHILLAYLSLSRSWDVSPKCGLVRSCLGSRLGRIKGMLLLT